jgi:hypothetical protein
VRSSNAPKYVLIEFYKQTLQGFKVLLVDVPKPSTPEPDVKLVDIFRINMYLGRVRL